MQLCAFKDKERTYILSYSPNSCDFTLVCLETGRGHNVPRDAALILVTAAKTQTGKKK